ncbi:Glycosyl phosphatidyl inositol anchor synthesis [Myotisia sp. PD_48]|nr:Glycosyl phosphatidyl inositol anchor synthesis [Myotisia sp. PD_48]
MARVGRVGPIVSGMREYGVEREPGARAPAKRLFLFVGDGLRADKAFQSFPDPSPRKDGCPIMAEGKIDPNCEEPEPDLTPKPLAPFIRSRVLSHGTFGVSHTRVPTESRPGHVALIAGLYEDVSAVTTGWKLNPVNFDSVFNRSRHTWSWGSPDILPMFKEGAVPGRIDADTYNEEAEDFIGDSVLLDLWVFDRVKALFAAAEVDKALDARLRQDKIVFFLHLLGLDTAGHGYRPYSKEYLHNIKVVDQGVREITELVEDFYDDDGQSAFVFTADHGMSDWGSHGDGHPDNTRTPLVVWGAGVAKPKNSKKGIAPGHEDGFSSDWNLDHIQRHDVAQADVAALMAYLVGLDFPVNSVGELPLSYIDASPREKAQAALANAQGVLEMYRVKEEQKRSSALRYKGYSAFVEPQSSPNARIAAIKKLISRGKYEASITKSRRLLHDGLEGLRYLQTYDWLFLRAIVTAGYLGWIAFSLTTVLDLHVLHGTAQSVRSTASNMLFSSLAVVLYSILWVQKSSWRYYAYAIFPIYFWEEVFARRAAIAAGRKALMGTISSPTGYISLALKIFAYIGLLQALVQSYFHREIYTMCYLFASLWPLLYGVDFVRRNKLVVATWSVGCGMLSIFTLLPVIKVDSASLVSLGGALMFLIGLLYLIFEDAILSRSNAKSLATTQFGAGSRLVMGAQVGLIALSIIVTRSSIASIQSKTGLPFGNQMVGWASLILSFVLPFLHRFYPIGHDLHRLIIIFLSFSPTFIILTISYEGLFYLVYCVTLLSWVRLEHSIFTHTMSKSPKATPESTKSTQTMGQPAASTLLANGASPSNTSGRYRTLTLSDARIALFFFFLLQSAFFSTGNIASVSSFSLDSVYRLIPIFNPFSQAALLILKILIPFAVLSANLGILNRRLHVAPSALFMIVMSISDIMTLNFFYMVRDEGSWLDIGTTISHFCISSALCVFVAGIEFLSETFIAGVDIVETDFVVDSQKQNGIVEPSGASNAADESLINGHTHTVPQNDDEASKNSGGWMDGSRHAEKERVAPEGVGSGSNGTTIPST